MSIYFGNDTVNDLYIGLTPVSKGYVGTHLFYNGDDTIVDLTYEKYILNTQFSTLYNTAEKPVKSAILSGQTKPMDELGNECDHPNRPNAVIGAYINTSTGEEILTNASFRTTYIKAPHETFKIRGKNRWKKLAFYDINKKFIKGIDPKLNNYSDYVVDSTLIPSNAEYMRISGALSTINSGDVVEPVLEILDVNNSSLYITQLQSCKMPVLKTVGKNLCGGLEQGGIASTDGSLTEASNRLRTKDFITIYPGSYFISVNTDYELAYRLYDMNGVLLFSPTNWKMGDQLTVTENSKLKVVIRKRNNGSVSPTNDIGLQVERGSTITTYEPPKSNILSCNEEVELCAIGDVKDELNMLTGEMTKRFGVAVMDGSDDEVYIDNWDSVSFVISRNNPIFDNIKINSVNITSDKYVYERIHGDNTGKSGFYWQNSALWFRTPLENLGGSHTQLAFKTWLQSNPITVQYELATPIVKTVDLSVVDQDGKNTKLSTFNDITHVTLSSEGLIPEAELEVATKNDEVLNTLSLEMDDIFTTQTTLEETSDTQSENVDATMVATTEIYEQLL